MGRRAAVVAGRKGWAVMRRRTEANKVVGETDTRVSVGARCSVCGLGQFDTPSGPSCPNGHGGAPAADPEATALAGDLRPGDVVRWVAGKQLLSPIQYFSFEVGPIEAAVTVQIGETAAEAYQRARAAAEQAFEIAYADALEKHLRLVAHAAQATAEARRGRR